MWIHSGPSIPDLGAFFSPLVPKEMHNQFCNVLLITPFGIGWYLSLQKQVPKILLNPLSHFIFVYIMISSCNYIYIWKIKVLNSVMDRYLHKYILYQYWNSIMDRYLSLFYINILYHVWLCRRKIFHSL